MTLSKPSYSCGQRDGRAPTILTVHRVYLIRGDGGDAGEAEEM